VPPTAPPARGRAVSTHYFVNADLHHVGDRMTRRSHTGVLIFVNRDPIMWYSKRQNGVEASTFGSEFIAMKTAVELMEALRYKLRMFGIPIECVLRQRGSGQEHNITGIMFEEEAQFDCVSLHSRAGCCWNDSSGEGAHGHEHCGFVHQTVAWTEDASVGIKSPVL
jgi:hypothetical protein